jgi:hypothetical protein
MAIFGCGPAQVQRAPAPRQISASGTGAYEAALATRPDGFVTAWYDTRDGNAEIYMRLLDAAGRPAGPERRLTNSVEESYEPSIALAGDGVAVAWYDKAADGTLTAKLGVWTLEGVNRWTTTVASPGRNPVISEYAGDIFCAWIAAGPDGEMVWARWWWFENGSAGEPARPLGRAGKTTWNLNAVAGDFGTASVVFDATAGTKADEVFFASVSPSGIELSRITDDDGVPSKYPDIAGVGLTAITWYDERDGNEEVYLLTAGLNEIVRGTFAVPPRRVTATPGESIGAYVASSLVVDEQGRIGLAWSDDTSGQHEIYFQPFDRFSRPLAPARRVTRNGTSSLIPAIEPWRDGFALAWNEYVPGAEGHVGTSEIAFAIVE